MGTDIHGGFIKRTKTESSSLGFIETKWGMDRNYLLFAILAGVRNGFGFAGSYRHEPLNPIAEGRGLPDFITDNPTEPECFCGEWLGDHSQTYMTTKEILCWGGWKEHLISKGIPEDFTLGENYQGFLIEVDRINSVYGEDTLLVIGFDN